MVPFIVLFLSLIQYSFDTDYDRVCNIYRTRLCCNLIFIPMRCANSVNYLSVFISFILLSLFMNFFSSIHQADREGYIAIIMPKPGDWLKIKASLVSLQEYKKLKEVSWMSSVPNKNGAILKGLAWFPRMILHQRGSKCHKLDEIETYLGAENGEKPLSVLNPWH